MAPEPHRGGASAEGKVEDYEPPTVTWEEPYDPVGLSASCVRSEGLFQCLSGLFNP
jgi:hypothetical protein